MFPPKIPPTKQTPYPKYIHKFPYRFPSSISSSYPFLSSIMTCLLMSNRNHIYGNDFHSSVYQNMRMEKLYEAHINLGKNSGNTSPSKGSDY